MKAKYSIVVLDTGGEADFGSIEEAWLGLHTDPSLARTSAEGKGHEFYRNGEKITFDEFSWDYMKSQV